ncbi:MAG: hypothetical protein OHK0013_15610 [Sandaracinaceae bacterium]
MNRRWQGLGCALALAGAVQGCGSEAGSRGEALFSGPESARLGSATNAARCSTCHAVDPAERGGSGDAMMNIAYRSSFKGGMAPTLLDATNACVVGWMGGAPLAETSPDFVALRTFFESVSDPAVTAPNTMMPEVLADEAAYEAAYAGGDPIRGQAAYERYCARCHEGALDVAGVPSFPRAILATRTIGRIAQKVRTSGPVPSGTMDATDTTGGPMPFFEPDELPREELRDLIAYVRSPG